MLFLATTLVCAVAGMVMAEDEAKTDKSREDILLYELGLKKRIVTYNTDLIPTACAPSDISENKPVQCSYEQRRAEQIKVINKDQYLVEFMCLQGVFYERDALEIIEKTKPHYPYAYSFVHDEDGNLKEFGPPCSGEDALILTFLAVCEYNMCFVFDTVEERFGCLKEKCGIDFIKHLSADCITCFFLGTVNNPAEECLMKKYAFNPTGLLVLSKAELLDKKRAMYNNQTELIRRGFLDVTVKGIGRILCTQLTENLGKNYVELNDEYGSYEAKNQRELEKLFKYVKDVPNVIIAGDMSISPIMFRGGSIKPQFEERVSFIHHENFLDPVADHFEFVSVGCSVCIGNPMVQKRYKEEGAGTDGYLFDHILVRGFNVSRKLVNKMNADTFRVFEETYNNNHHPLSSHYGYLITLLLTDNYKEVDIAARRAELIAEELKSELEAEHERSEEEE